MGFQCGIVGLPNVGKSTLFNALTESSVEASNYPFCTIDPNVGMVAVPDPRLSVLAELVQPQTILPTNVQFVDIAGLVSGAAQGEGLGNQFLSHIREMHALAHVVRCYEDDNVTHVAGRVDPVGDIEVVHTELLLADIETLEKALLKTAKQVRSGDKAVQQTQVLLERVKAHLERGQPARSFEAIDVESTILKNYHLLTHKPVLYVANVSETGFSDNPYLSKLMAFAEQENAQVVAVCALVESEIVALDPAERSDFLSALGWDEPGLHRFIRAGYNLLGLQTFFTAGEKEVRAWTMHRGDTAPQAAGVIHSDFERYFIRAEVITYEDFVRCGGEQGAKAAGVWRLEGKDYVVQDGDVIHFRSRF